MCRFERASQRNPRPTHGQQQVTPKSEVRFVESLMSHSPRRPSLILTGRRWSFLMVVATRHVPIGGLETYRVTAHMSLWGHPAHHHAFSDTRTSAGGAGVPERDHGFGGVVLSQLALTGRTTLIIPSWPVFRPTSSRNVPFCLTIPSVEGDCYSDPNGGQVCVPESRFHFRPKAGEGGRDTLVGECVDEEKKRKHRILTNGPRCM